MEYVPNSVEMLSDSSNKKRNYTLYSSNHITRTINRFKLHTTHECHKIVNILVNMNLKKYPELFKFEKLIVTLDWN